MSLKKYLHTGAFALLIIGTLGLLLNEFLFDWGRAAVLLFAGLNLVGLLLLLGSGNLRKQAG